MCNRCSDRGAHQLASPALLIGLLFGQLRVDDAIAAGQLAVTGSKAEARRFFKIFQLGSPN